MIYLIGGSPRCGKTIVAKNLSKRLGISWISSDMLESVISLYVPAENYDNFFPKSVIRRNTKQSNDQMYTQYTSKQIVRTYIKQSKASWKAIAVIIEICNKEGLDFIIEGYHIHPQFISNLQDKYPGLIKSVILFRKDVESIVKGCRVSIAKNDWFIQKTKNKQIHYKIAEMIVEFSIFFEKEASKYKINIVNIDNDFQDKVNQAVNQLSASKTSIHS